MLAIVIGWKQLEGKVKAKWGKLTADDLTAINGRREELEGKIQQRYGIAKDQAERKSTTGSRRKAFDIDPTGSGSGNNPSQGIPGPFSFKRLQIWITDGLVERAARLIGVHHEPKSLSPSLNLFHLASVHIAPANKPCAAVRLRCGT